VRPSIEAAFGVESDNRIPAGPWHLIGDGIVLEPCDVRYDLLLRDDQGDHPITTWSNHFEPSPSGDNHSQPFEAETLVAAVDAKSGDQLVLRITAEGESGTSGTSGQTVLFIPNGDGALANGRIPSLTRPH
jgi:hypothetical protein